MKIGILAAASGYQKEQIQPWIVSLRKTGFSGPVGVIIYDNNQDLGRYLSSQGVTVFSAQLNGLTNIATQRFLDYSEILQKEPFSGLDYIIHTDIRDVVFQQNPEIFVGKSKSLIIATTEGVTYNHEDWNGEGMQFNFGENMFNSLKDVETLCSGIIAGERKVLISLFITIYELAFYTPNPEGFADQHFYNVALRKIYNTEVEYVPSDVAWVANLGTLIALPMSNPDWSTSDKTLNLSFPRTRKGTYIDNMLVKLPQLINGEVCTPTGVPYPIVHQYDRYPAWRDAILTKVLGIAPKNQTLKDSIDSVAFYMWAYDNVESVDYIFTELRKHHANSDVILSSDAGEDFTSIADKHSIKHYIHGTERHGYPSQDWDHKNRSGRWGWTMPQAKIWLDRFYEACTSTDAEYIMMMDEDVLVKTNFQFTEADMIMTPNIQNPISKAGMSWVGMRGGRTDYPYYSFGGGSLIKTKAFIEAYNKHKESFFMNYEEIFQTSLTENIWSWGWNDCMLCSIMYANGASFVTNLPVSESGNELDPEPIIHKFKKYYRKK